MPFERERYPSNWDEISTRIKERANYRCEQCGVEHGAEITRSSVDASRYIVLKEDGCFYYPNGEIIRLSEIPDEFDISHYSRVVLTTHHIGAPHADGTPGDLHDKMDCRDENLIALCQRCHFIADLPSHIESARKSRIAHKRERILAQGQLELFGRQDEPTGWSQESINELGFNAMFDNKD